MKLAVKTLWLPLALLVLIFLAMAGGLSRLIVVNNQQSLEETMRTMVANEGGRLASAMRLLTATQVPADAFIGLEGRDDGMAQDLVRRVASMGLDGVFITDLKGKPLFTTSSGQTPASLTNLVAGIKPEPGAVAVRFVDGRLVGLGVITDVETPKGLLGFVVGIPTELAHVAATALNGEQAAGAGGKTSELLAAGWQGGERKSEVTLRQVLITLGGSLLTGLLLFSAVLGVTARGIIRPTRLVQQTVDLMAAGNLLERIPLPAGKKRDEILEMADRVNVMADHMADTVRNILVQADTNAAVVHELKEVSRLLAGDTAESSRLAEEVLADNSALHAITNDLTVNMVEASRDVERASQAVDGLFETIAVVATGAEEASQNASTVAAAMEEMTANLDGVNLSLGQVNVSVEAVAAAIEELNASLNEVRNRCDMAYGETGRTIRQMESNREFLDGLEQATRSIGDTVSLINRIAGQTNMLALNAAIEAAGAGEAGLGFAVVAGEVKGLAQQTADATRLIAQSVTAIEQSVARVVRADQESIRAMESIHQANQEIAHTVTEQNATVAEIARSMDGVASASREVTRNSQEMQRAAEDVSRAVAQASKGTAVIAHAATEAADLAQEVKSSASAAAAKTEMVRQASEQVLLRAAEVQKKTLQMINLTHYSQGSAQQSEKLAQVIVESSEALRASVSGLRVDALAFDVREVKQAHLAWLGTLEQVVRRRRLMEPGHVGDHHGCALGRWWDGEGQRLFANHPLRERLDEVHARVHTLAREIVELVHHEHKTGMGGSPSSRKHLDERLSSFNTSRRELFVLLDEVACVRLNP